MAGNDRLPPSQADNAANSGQDQEQRIATVPFSEFALNIYREHSGNTEPSHWRPFFAGARRVYEGPLVPMIGLFADPPWRNRSRTKINMFGVNDLGDSRIAEHAINGGTAENMRPFIPYDFDVNKLSDPTVTVPLREISAYDIEMVTDLEQARARGSRVFDPRVRDLITQWFDAQFNNGREDSHAFSRKADEIKKYTWLRKVPYNKTDIPSYAQFTYEGAVEEATRQYKSEYDPAQGKVVDVPVTSRLLFPADIEWLNEHMRNLGMEIPGK